MYSEEKLGLMSAIIFSTMEDPNAEIAIDKAFEIDRKVSDKLRSIKDQKRRTIERNHQQLTDRETR